MCTERRFTSSMCEHWSKVWISRMKIAGVTVYTNQTFLSISDGKMFTFNIPQKRKYLLNVHKINGAHFICMNNRYAKFEYKRLKSVGVTYYANQTPPKHFGCKNVLVQYPSKMKIIFINVHSIEGAHLHCVKNHYVKFEYKEMKSFRVTDYTSQTPSKHFE